MSWRHLLMSLAYTFISYGLASLRPQVQGPQLVQGPPSRLQFSNNSGAVLNCVAQGSPAPQLRWLDSAFSEVVYIPRLRELLGNGSLYLPPFSAEQFDPQIHAASYYCRASNIAGVVLSTECRVRAVVWQPFQAQVNNAFVTKGNVAVLQCAVPGFARDWLQVAGWIREDQPSGRSNLHTGGRYWLTQSGDLHVRDTAPSDSYDRYYCWAADKLTGARRFSSPGQIIVTVPEEEIAPVIEHVAASVHVKVGSTAELICIAKGNPPPTYRWYRELSGTLQEVRHPAQTVLRLERAQHEDAGRYLCSVNSMVGEDRREMVLLVSAPLSVQVRPQRLVADWGSAAIFTCIATGTSPHIHWLRDGRQLSGSDATLVIRAVSRQDQGMYQCVVQDGEDSVQASAQLLLGAVAPELLSTFSEQTTRPGPAVSLSCTASGDPPPQLSWMLDGVPLPARGYIVGSFVHATGDVVGHLNVSSVHVHHGGVYSCHARNHMGVVSHSAALNVYGPPTARAPLNMTLAAGSDAELRCPVAGYPVSKVTWRRGQEPLGGVMPNGSLVVRKLQAERHSGEYHCSLTNPQGQTGHGVVYLSIKNPPRIAPFQFAPNLEKGMRALLSCSIMSGDLPITISWRKDGDYLPQDHGLQEKREEFASTLVFRDLGTRHSGQYTCIASNEAASTNYTASLTIRVPPSWLKEPEDVSALYQQPATLHCQATGFPVPAVSWFLGPGDQLSKQTRLQPDHNTLLFGNGSVLLRTVQPSQEGHYTCRADNGIGAGIYKTIFLRVNVPAHFKTRSLNQSGVLGKPVTLVCDAEGDLPLRVSWSTPQRASSPASSSERHTQHGVTAELSIPRLARQHAGAYHCVAANNFGQDHMVVYLAIKEPPEAPLLVHVPEVGSRWLSLAWAPASQDHPPVLHYVAQYRPGEGGSWSNLTVDSATRNVRVGGLQPSTTYSVRLVAVNEVGESLPSDAVAVTTLQEPPSGPPTDVYAKATSSKSIVIQWKPPSTGRGKLLGYQVTCREVSSGKLRTRTVRGASRLQVSLPHLRQFARYEVAVRAFNVVGAGPPSPPLLVTTLEGVPDRPPKDVQCVALSSTSIRVRWEPPPVDHRNGIIEAYKVFYSRLNPVSTGSSFSTEVKRTSNLETMLHGLAKFSNYSIRVASITGAGEGVHSLRILCVTEEDVPGPPELLKALAMTSDSILLSWTAPAEPNGKIIKYIVYSLNSGSQDVRQESVPADRETMLKSRQLKEHHRYEFWVTAVSSGGEGSSSARVHQSPTSRVPARIASFSRRLWAGVGGGVLLPCHAVGLPNPGWSWRGPGGAGVAALHEATTGRFLALSLLRPEHSGNYTCVVENVFGRDEVTHELMVQVPPGPPVISVTATTTDTISLTWRDSSTGGSPITGYSLKYRRSSEEWQQVQIYPEYTMFTIRDLKCGSSYQMSLTATNAVGSGKPSTIIVAFTKGSAPTAPAEDECLQVNSSAATVYLESWPDGGCPLRRWEAEYRLWAGGGGWTTAIPSQRAEEVLVLRDLASGTWYALRVTAHNDAGSYTHQFVFATRTRTGEILAPHTIPAVPESENTDDFHLNIVVPVASGIICTVAVSLCACMLVHKRNEMCYAERQPASDAKCLAELQNQRNSKQQQQGESGSPCEQMYLPSPLRKNFHKQVNSSGQEYELGPYEMFSVTSKVASSPSMQAMDYCAQFQTFSHQECTAGCRRNHGDDGVGASRTRSSGTLRSAESLEISCISSQQTLQLGAMSVGLHQPRVDPSDSDSSEADQRHVPATYTRRTPRHEGRDGRESITREALPRHQQQGRYPPRADVSCALDRTSGIDSALLTRSTLDLAFDINNFQTCDMAVRQVIAEQSLTCTTPAADSR